MKLITIFVFVVTCFISFSCFSDEINSVVETDVIVTSHDEKILAFSIPNNRWEHLSKRLGEEIISIHSSGKLGVVVTSTRVLAFSSIANKWIEYSLSSNENVGGVIVENKGAVVITSDEVIAINANSHQWLKAP